MIKGRFFIILLFFSLRLLPALDVYLNGELWQTYSDEKLRAFLLPASSGIREEKKYLPLREVLPLMTEWQTLQIRIPSGEILLEGEDLQAILNRSVLEPADNNGWLIRSGDDICHDPLRINLRGNPDTVDTLTVWADPDLPDYREQLILWGRLHQISIVYREMDRLRDEIIHRKMTGDYLPDFVLTRLHPADDWVKEEIMSYQLSSAVTVGTGTKPVILLPEGQIANPELFFSILVSRIGDSRSEQDLADTAGYYSNLLQQGIIRDIADSATDRDTRLFYYPAELKKEQKGELTPLPLLPGMTAPPATRIIPIVLRNHGPLSRGEALKSFLHQEGIQLSLYNPEMRHLPAVFTEEGVETSLFDELESGYILYSKNYILWERLSRNLPVLLIHNTAGDGNE